MTKLYDTLTANQVGALTEKCDAWSESQMVELIKLPLPDRQLKIEHGLYGRVRKAQATLCLLALAVRALDDDMPSILLPDSVVVALHDAQIEVD